MIRSLIGAALAVLCSGASLAAQTCDYDRCALRMRGGRVVQGADERPVSQGTFVRRVEPLATAGDSIRAHYEQALRHQRRDVLLGGASLLVLAGALVVADDGLAGSAAPWAAVAVGTAANDNASRGENHLRRAIWLYNRGLPAAADSGCAYDECGLAVLANRTVVRGLTETRLGRAGAANVRGLFDAADDSTRARYERYRVEERRARQGLIAGLALAAAGTVLLATSDDDLTRGGGLVLLGGGAVLGQLANGRRAEASNQLERAVWLYNRRLPRR